MVFGGGSMQIEGDLLAWICALLAPLAYATSIVLVKHHADDESAAALTMASGVVSALLVLPFAVPGFALPAEPAVWPLMALIGFLGAAGFVLLTIGLRTTAASVFAIVDYMNILWAALFGFVFFHEIPELRFWIGGRLIIAACALGAVAAARPGSPALLGGEAPALQGRGAPVVVGKLIGRPRSTRTARKRSTPPLWRRRASPPPRRHRLDAGAAPDISRSADCAARRHRRRAFPAASATGRPLPTAAAVRR